MDSVNLREIAGEGVSVFSNEHIGMVVNGSPHRTNLLHDGGVYHVEETRLVIVRQGEADIALDLENYHLEEGTVVLTRPDIIMEVKTFSPSAEIIGIVMREDIGIRENLIVKTSGRDYGRLTGEARLMWELVHLEPFPRETVQRLASAMAADVEYLHRQTVSREMSAPPSRKQQLFRRFKELVNENCGQERRIAYYAGRLWISPHHLSSVIGDASGHSVMYWINRATLLKAKVMLKTGMMSYEVADALNFPNPAAFSRFFKRETGQTPGEYQATSR